jgi:Domain of unknown function (DUF4263)
MNDCHKNFWDLISYLKSMKELDIPDESFSLVAKDASQIVTALGKRDAASIKNIIKLLSGAPGLAFSEQDVNDLLQRKARLSSFKAQIGNDRNEAAWQKFFTQNKWIFGYGLKYVILRLEQPQANVGGAGIDGRGAKIPDFLASTGGTVRFTVLVEIKTPDTKLLSVSTPIRSGAWSLSKELTDALTQIQASVEEWSHYGSKHPKNATKFDKDNIRTVKPKGIIVIGNLSEVGDDPEKLATFELFRRSLHGIEIITFDELYERARFVVEHSAD